MASPTSVLFAATVSRSGFAFRLQRLGVPPEVRAVFVRAALAGFAGFDHQTALRARAFADQVMVHG